MTTSTLSWQGEVLRRCALALHAAHEVDRSWLLQRLPAEASAEIGRLISELQAIGISRDPAMLDVVNRVESRSRKSKTSTSRVATVSPRVLADQLRSEPPGYIWCAIASRPTVERNAVLTRLPRDLRLQVLAWASRHGKAGPGERACLGAAVQEELSRRAAVQQPPARGWRRWFA